MFILCLFASHQKNCTIRILKMLSGAKILLISTIMVLATSILPD